MSCQRLRRHLLLARHLVWRLRPELRLRLDYYAPSYGYASSYYAPSYGYASYYAPSYGYASSYYAPSYGYASSYGSGYGGYDFGRPGYNPGGLGGPWSGLGVRPGVGLGGFGLRR